MWRFPPMHAFLQPRWISILPFVIFLVEEKNADRVVGDVVELVDVKTEVVEFTEVVVGVAVDIIVVVVAVTVKVGVVVEFIFVLYVVGSGDAGSGDAGSGDADSGDADSGDADSGDANSVTVGSSLVIHLAVVMLCSGEVVVTALG